MRVLLINHFPLAGSGSGVYTCNIANSLLNLGHEVCIVYPTNQLENATYPFKTHPVYFTDAEGNAPVPDALPFNFPCFTTHPKSINTFEDLNEAELAQYRDAFATALAQEKEAFQPDIVHAGHIWILADLGGNLGVPLVITAHGTDLIGYQKSTRYHQTAQSAADKASAIVAISQKSYNEIAAVMPFALDKTHLISNGYNDRVFYRDAYDRAQVLAGFGIDAPFKNVVSFAGKFAHFKGIDILLRAAAQYEDDQTVTLLAGDGELFDEMTALAADLGLKNVHFLHNQTHDVLRGLYNIADVSLVPSRKEPFGLVAIEAGACGAPVIGTNDGGMTDILCDQNGILIDPESPDQLACAVKSILEGQRTFDHAAVAAYTKSHFSQDQFTQRMIDQLYIPAIG